MTDGEFTDLVEQKSIGKKLNIRKKEVIEEFLVMKIFQIIRIILNSC